MGITFFEWGKIKNGNCLVTFYGKKPSVNGGVIMTYGDLTNRKRGLTNNHGLLKESQIKNRNLDHIIPYIYIYRLSCWISGKINHQPSPGLWLEPERDAVFCFYLATNHGFEFYVRGFILKEHTTSYLGNYIRDIMD